MKEKIKENWAILVAWSLSFLGFGLMIGYALNPQFNDGSGIINTSIANDFGSFIGGIAGPIFTLAGMFLLYETIITQKKTFQIQQFETRFFELVRYHRENVANLSYKMSNSTEGEFLLGTSVLTELKKQLIDLYKISYKFHQEKGLFDTDDKVEQEAINTAFLLLFFGVSLHNKQTLLEYLNIRYPNEVSNEIIEKLRKKKTKYNEKYVYYGGHQSKIGYYFRHIFQTIWYVDFEKTLNDEKREAIVRLFRSQLSSSEQALLFFFTLSELGTDIKASGLITKYELVKNIQRGFIHTINPKRYFPEIKFDWEKKMPLTMHSTPMPPKPNPQKPMQGGTA